MKFNDCTSQFKERDVLVCSGCNARISNGNWRHVKQTKLFADLDGKAYQSYYCEECKDQLEGGTRNG